jgi:ubiquinone/menaquinone biosynthesis C-methylase UbiE
MKNRKTVEAWSSYWLEGNKTSLPNLFAENYDGDVARFWDEVFTSLSDNNRVLDICTGNGAIAVLANDHVTRRGIGCEIHAIDVANIHATEAKKGANPKGAIKFHSGVAVEATQFPDMFFNLVVGQFALEYCDIEDGIKELSRIIKKDGRVVLMLHHENSASVVSTGELIGIAHLFIEEPSIFFRLRKYAEQYANKRELDTPKATKRRNNLIASINHADRLLEQFPNNRFLRITLDNIKNLAGRVQMEGIGGLAEIRKFEKTVKQHLIRVQDQRRAALDDDKIADIKMRFDRNGFTSVSYEPYFIEGVLFSWTLVARRNSSDGSKETGSNAVIKEMSFDSY